METDVIESAIVAAGGIGPYQLRTLVILTIPLIALTGLWQFPIFYGMTLPHECHELNNTFVGHQKHNYTDCMMTSTYVSEFELYCDKKYAAPWLASAANIGGLIGHLFWGVCQDIFGRRASTITCSMLTFTFALAICYVPNITFNGLLPEYTMFLVLRFLFGVCANGMGSYTLPIELVSAKNRWTVGLFYGTGWGLGTFWHLASVYLFRNWRDAMLMQVMPLAASVLYVWLLPESPRWLARKGKKEQALKIIKDMAKANGKDVEEALKQAAESINRQRIASYHSEEQDNTICQHFSQNVSIFIRFLLLSSLHLIGATLWYTIIFSVGGLPGCIFTTYFIFGLIEGPLRLALQGFLLKWARRKGIAMGIGGAAIFFVISVLLQRSEVKDNYQTTILVFGLLAKLLSTFYWPFIETYNGELNPTIIRDSVGGLTSAIGGIGGVITPALLLWQHHTLSISIVSICATSVLCLLPSTLNQTLPNTMEDALAMEDKLSDFINKRRRKRSSNPTEMSHLSTDTECNI